MTQVDVDHFRRSVQELGLIRPEEFERIMNGMLGLAMALVRAGS